jgi:hypothetical protein
MKWNDDDYDDDENNDDDYADDENDDDDDDNNKTQSVHLLIFLHISFPSPSPPQSRLIRH